MHALNTHTIMLGAGDGGPVDVNWVVFVTALIVFFALSCVQQFAQQRQAHIDRAYVKRTFHKK